MRRLLVVACFLAACSSVAPRERFVPVADGTKLHVLEWGTGGDAVVLLAGLSNTAYIYSDFAPRLSGHHHVIAITRRGHGRSGDAKELTPEASARDIHDVMDALHSDRAHLAGHSIAGVELTAFGTLYPERTRSLIYLDAAYDRKAQAVWDESGEDPVAWNPPSKKDLASVDAYLAKRHNEEAQL